MSTRIYVDYDQEEADTGIVSLALNVTQRKPFFGLVISCSVTDVLLILLYYFEHTCRNTVLKIRFKETHFKN